MSTKARRKLTKTDFIQRIIELFAEHQITTKAILFDYVADQNMIDELGEVDNNFISDLEDLRTESDIFDLIIKQLEEIKYNHYLDTDQCEALMNLMEDDFKIHFVEKELDKDNYTKVQVKGRADRMKLENFINSEIYPYNVNYGESISL
jgi:hypothetical protein